MNSQHSSVFHYTSKVLIISTIKIDLSQQYQVLDMFSHFGFIDVAIASENEDDVDIAVMRKLRDSMSIYRNVYKSKIIFPDKLKNLNGYAYKVVIHQQPPRLVIENRTIRTPLSNFLSIIGKVQNATFNFFAINDYRDLAIVWEKRQMDLTLNDAIAYPTAQYPKLLTYEETGYCALVPRPPKVPMSEMIYVKPFDMYTWMLLIFTITCCGVVWKMFHGRGAVGSHWLLIYGIFVMFIGQGVDYSRRNRMVLSILLELIILMIFVLSNAYEGVITSFMIQPIQENRLERFDQILAGKYEIMTDEAFAWTVKDSKEFQAVKSRINTSAVQMHSRYGYELIRQKYVFIRNCYIAEHDINSKITADMSVSDFYYLLPERIINYYVRLEASYFNPFIERLQYYMDLCYQAGLPHLWKIYSSDGASKKSNQQSSPEPDILHLADLLQVFYILFIGYSVAALFLLIEIFFQDVLKNLRLAYLGKQLRSRVNKLAYKKKKPNRPEYQRGALYYIIRQHKKVKRLRKLKVRRIFVQPRNSVD